MLFPIPALGGGEYSLVLAGGEDVDLAAELAGTGWTAGDNARVVVTADVTSSARSVPALRANAEGGTITIVVNSGVSITGAGGKGANGGDDQEAGERGGSAILVTQACRIENEGTIAGGGGGGGGGFTGSGGGGAGIVAGLGGSRSGFTAGSNGTATTGGAGGADGGAGGDLGQAGSAGADGGGGQAGRSIEGYSLVTYSGGGTLTGPTG